MNWLQPKVFAVKHKIETIRAASRSGGIFTALSDTVLESKGVVYGCILTSDFQAVHVRAESKTKRDLMRGSKYIQSKIGDTYKSVQTDLKNGKKVLFSGTSCQIAGLRNFIGDEVDNLLCVDIVCHGVPSPLVWKKYLEWQERKAHTKVKVVDFRNKQDFGWRTHIETLTMANGKKVSSEIFKNLFYGHNILRPSCYKCPFKSIMHPGDITIADYWGIEKAASEFDDNKGVSLVLVNNDKGMEAFEAIKETVTWKQTKIEESMQPPLKAPFTEPSEREQFWKDLKNKSFNYVTRQYSGAGIINKIKRRLRKIRRKLVG